MPIGAVGELCLGGAGLARGYWRRPELTREKFIRNPVDPARSPLLYRTGDLARWLPDGRLDFLGRMDSQVKVNGYRIELGEIEAVLGSHPQVRMAVALASKVAESDVRLRAFVVLKDGASVNAKELLDASRKSLPEYMLPRHLAFLDALPLNANGKVDRKALEALPLESGPARPAAGERPPADSLEGELLRIWRELLKRRDASLTDDFFASGGHSLLAIRLCARIKAELGLNLGLGELLQHPSVEGLAGLLRHRSAAAEDRVAPVTLQGAGSLPPLFLVHPIGGTVYSYRPLASQLGKLRPVLAFEAPAISGRGPCRASVRELASDYVWALLATQPRGKYHLAGWSFGGVVAFEMARILESQGRKVAFLGLIDSILPSKRDRDLLRDQPGWLAEAFSRDLSAASAGKVNIDSKETEQLFKVYEAHALALLDYRPGPLQGGISLYMATEKDRDREDSIDIWSRGSSGRVDLQRIPGDHYSIMSGASCTKMASLIGGALAMADLFETGKLLEVA
jgi:thioesterase domain-containing protein